MTPYTRLLALLALFSFALTANAQTTPPPVDPPQKEVPKADDPAKADDDDKETALKKYADIVTKKAVSQSGMFKVHRIGDKILFEIPQNMLGREMLWQTELAQLPTNTSYSGEGVGAKVVRWTRRNNKIYMRAPDYSVRAEGDDNIKLGVQETTVEPIIQDFDVLTEGKSEDGKPTAVIDVTSLYTSDPSDFSVKSAIGASGVDSSRSYVDKVKAFPENIETRSMLTFSRGGGRDFGSFGGFGGGDSPSASTALVHYSLALLPVKPMMGRLKDSRIGYFTQGFDDYGGPENRMMHFEYIDRFRLEKKDPSAALSEPVKPIVFYISREVPLKWRPWLKKAVEDWQPAFEQAGFKNAIIAKDAPSVEQDPDWDPEDARYSVIRWAPSPVANAMGPSIQDPRSGETISAHVIFWNNVVELVEYWYFSQTAAIDPAARKMPFSDELMGSLMRYVAAHEVGHTLGLEHNMKASTAYSIAQLRDPKFTSEYGVSPSIMDYSRFNYVAQPGDGVTRTIGMIGPYDKFAIEYGYKPIPSATTPDQEKPVLDQILARQVSDARLRFGNYRFYQDPTTQSEDISNDPIAAGTLGLRNIDRIASNYLWNTATKFGEDYSRLSALRGELLGQRTLELFHVVAQLGGVVETDYHAGRGGEVFKPVSAARQAQAARFLIERGLEKPAALYDPKILNRIEPDGVIDEATSIPRIIMSSMLSESRVKRMLDNQATNGDSVYTVNRMLGDLTNGVFAEVQAPSPKIDVYRRTLQRAYLDTMDKRVNGSSASKTDLKPLAKQELRSLAVKIDKALPRTTDRMTALHLSETRKDIGKILDGKYSTAGGGGGSSFADFFGGIKNKDGCWVAFPTALREILK